MQHDKLQTYKKSQTQKNTFSMIPYKVQTGKLIYRFNGQNVGYLWGRRMEQKLGGEVRCFWDATTSVSWFEY